MAFRSKSKSRKARSSKPRNQVRNDWVRRRQNIGRGIKIALYEINQALALHGLRVETPPDFIPYTVAVAEGGRQNASIADVRAMAAANLNRAIQRAGLGRRLFVVSPR